MIGFRHFAAHLGERFDDRAHVAMPTRRIDVLLNLAAIGEDADPIATKIEKIATVVYGADGIELSPAARESIRRYEEQGLAHLPICMAKTHLSLSHDPELLNAPTGFTVPVRAVRAYTGAGWLVALCGDMQTMPGYGRTPAAHNVDIDDEGKTVGLF